MTKKKNIEYYNNFAKAKGGRCLSSEYINAHIKYEWECKFQHRWFATTNKIQQGRWCPHCVNNVKKTIQDCQKLAKLHKGVCLSKTYNNNNTKMLWRCCKNHIFFMTSSSVKQGHWCPKCSNKIRIQKNIKYSINDLIKIAKLRGGSCLNNQYINFKYKYKWKCAENHIWLASFRSIKSGRWCPVCATDRRKKTIYKKYGVENVMQNIQIALKCAKSAKFSTILHHWKTREEVVCVGSYEELVVRYFNNKKIDFLWQSKVFQTPLLTEKGNRATYRPDIYLINEDVWIEVKGWIDRNPLTKQKWEWFHKHYPNSELWDKRKLQEMEIL